MKKGDFVWAFVLVVVIFVFVFPETNMYYKQLNGMYPYIVGFVKFFILATMGELLSVRIVKAEWKKPVGLGYRAVVWGFLGMVIVIIFDIFGKGVTSALKSGLLPFSGIPLAFAFFTSLIMNFTFAPTMMAFHRITDMFIEMYYETKRIPQIADVVQKINWSTFVDFVVLKTIPLFWIPAHTITFLLPVEYRVVAAAFLSIALGGILAFAAKSNVTKKKIAQNQVNKPQNKTI
jgi:hypothetical protein